MVMPGLESPGSRYGYMMATHTRFFRQPGGLASRSTTEVEHMNLTPVLTLGLETVYLSFLPGSAIHPNSTGLDLGDVGSTSVDRSACGDASSAVWADRMW